MNMRIYVLPNIHTGAQRLVKITIITNERLIIEGFLIDDGYKIA